MPLATSPDQSWLGLYATIAEMPMGAVRPGQLLWYVAFHKLAAGNATAVHLANHVVFVSAALLLHAALRAIPATTRAAYHVTLLYVCLPTFTVAKLWYANHQAVLSLLMFTFTALLLTHLARGDGRGRWLTLPLVFTAAVLGNFSYELFWITALLLPLFVWWGYGSRTRDLLGNGAFLAATGAIALAVGATTIFKLTFDYGVDVPASGTQVVQFAEQAAGMYLGAAKTTFWTLGAYSPHAAVGILSGPYADLGSLVAPILVLLVIGAREWLNGYPAIGEPARPAFFAVGGIVAWSLGYVPYLANFLYSAKPWGEGNRGNIAAALGVALLFFAAFRWASVRWPRLAATVLVAFCATGAFLQVAVGRMWVQAAVEQDRTLRAFTAITGDRLEDRGTVLLYRTCPYFGSGPVFAYAHDLTGRLVVEEGYRNIEANLVRPGMAVGEAGIETQPGRWGSRLFPYGSLTIVDMAERSVQSIDGPEDARRFFAAHPPERTYTCGFDYGVGTPLY